MPRAQAERGHDLGAERVDGVHGSHLAERKDAEERDALEIAAAEDGEHGHLLFAHLGAFDFHVHTVDAFHDGVRLPGASLACEPQGRLGHLTATNEQEDANGNR